MPERKRIEVGRGHYVDPTNGFVKSCETMALRLERKRLKGDGKAVGLEVDEVAL